MITGADLPRLKWAFASVALSIGLASAAVWTMDMHRVERLRALGDAQRAYRDAHSRYINAQRDEDLLRDTVARFDALKARGIAGDERRLEWIERVRSARERAGMSELDFELRPRRPLRAKPQDGVFQLTASTMSLSGDLRHEGHLLEFLDAVLEESSALPRVRRCMLERQHGDAAASTLSAICEIDWITIRLVREGAS